MDFFFLQTPYTCFPLKYFVSLKNGTTENISGPFQYSGTGREEITLSELHENMKYTATINATLADKYTYMSDISSSSEEFSFCKYAQNSFTRQTVQLFLHVM